MPIKDVYEVYSRAANKQLSNTELDALLLALSKEKERRANAEIEEAWLNLCNAVENFIRLNGSLVIREGNEEIELWRGDYAFDSDTYSIVVE